MWIKIKKWLSGNTASGIYAYTITKIGDAIWTPKNLGIMNAVAWYILGVALFFIFAFLFKKLFHTNNAEVPKQKPLMEVIGRTFIMQTVVLDGYRYVDCKFNNCTIEYRGENYGIDGSYMRDCQLSFNHPIAEKAVRLVYAQFKSANKLEDIAITDEYHRIIDDKIFMHKVEKPKL